MMQWSNKANESTPMLERATLILADQIQDLEPDKTLIMRAQNSGDMYHIRGAMVLNPEYSLLIWNVNEETRKQAQQAVDLVADLIVSANRKVYYTGATFLPNGSSLTARFNRSETWATKDIANFFSTNLFDTLNEFAQHMQSKSDSEAIQLKTQIGQLKQQLGQLKANDSSSYNELLRMGHKELAMEFADRYGAYSKEEGVAFQKDLECDGHFPAPDGSHYVIVNFRATGHSERPGANAPALDTGLVGVGQIIKAVEDALKDKKVVIVPMGEEPIEYTDRPNLLNYWLWPSTPNRRKQLALLKYLKDKYKIIGAIGMRSGVLDQIAFNDIRIISIDITPHRFDPQTGLPNVKPSKGWDRGLQLESAYDDAYGRVFVKYPRQQDLDRLIPNWKGDFDPNDVEAIISAVSFYFGGSFQGVRHATHPLQPEEMRQGLNRLPRPATSAVCYDLLNWLSPYINHLDRFKEQMSPDIKQFIVSYKDEVQSAIEAAEVKAQNLIEHQMKRNIPLIRIEWMCENQKQALLEGNITYQWYQEQVQFTAKELALSSDTEFAITIYRLYDKLYHLPVVKLLALTDIPC